MIRSYSARVDIYRNGAKFSSLKAADVPTISASESGAIKTGLSGEFYYNDSVDYLNDELRPVQIIDGVEFPTGVFHVSSYQDSYTEFGRTMQIEAYDKGFLLQSTTAEEILHFSKGESYLNIIEKLMKDAGITRYIEAPSEAVLATDREDWDIGTDYLTIINALLAEINYDGIWFNADGYAILQPRKIPDASNIKHSYSGMDIHSVLSADCTASTDIWDKPNVFIAICDNPDMEGSLKAIAVNDSPSSPLSTFRRGRRISRIYRVDNIANKEELQQYANNLRNESMFASESLTIRTANMPGHGIGDTVAVMHPQISGIYREIGWSLGLAAGQLMQHDLQRKVVL